MSKKTEIFTCKAEKPLPLDSTHSMHTSWAWTSLSVSEQGTSGVICTPSVSCIHTPLTVDVPACSLDSLLFIISFPELSILEKQLTFNCNSGQTSKSYLNFESLYLSKADLLLLFPSFLIYIYIYIL